MQSLIDNFTELDLHFAAITESWLKDGNALNAVVSDLNEGEDLDMITYNRTTRRRNKTAGGGIAIVFDKRKMKLKEMKVKKGKAEILCAAGKVTGMPRHIVIMGIYLRPQLKADLKKSALDCLKNAIALAKVNFNDPIIIVTGDVNKTPIGPSLADFPDLVVVPTPPTRGGVVLDIIATNLPLEATEAHIREPLVSEEGNKSDHKVIFVESQDVNSDRFTKIRYKVRKRTKRADERLRNWLASEPWDDVLDMSGAEEMAESFISRIEKKMNEL